MLRSTAKATKNPILSFLPRYAIAVIGVATAFALVSILQRFKVRDPFALVFLAAFAIGVWYGGTGPGILAFVLSTLGLSLFLHSPRGWLHIAANDVPVYSIFVLLGLLIYRFSRSRRHAEKMLEEKRNQLEEDVAGRTSELTRLNAEYATILDAVPFGIALLGNDRIVVRCNATYEKMLGVGPGELLGRSAPLPDSEKETWIRQEEELHAGKGIMNYETLRVRKDGTEFPATITAVPLKDVADANYSGIVGVIVDDTDRKRAEAKLQMFCSVVQNSPDFIGVADTSLHTVFVNRAGQKMFGLNGDDVAARTQTLDYFAEDQRSAVRDELIPLLLERGELTRELPARNFTTGKTFPALWTAFVIYDKKTEQPSLLAAVTKDITEQQEDRDALRKSLEDNEVLLEENRVLQDKLHRENISLHELNLALQGELADIQRNKFEKIIGASPALQRTLIRVDQVAATDATVLITGETGTGKELIAQAIHENSKRARMPFRSVNCAALPATLMAAELFGHEKGAFTGADRQRVGQFELAGGGTLFLDEIAEIPIDMQATLLRVLEERAFERLGGAKLIPADVRVIAATNRDLHAAMRAGEFRQDLFYRLNAFPIEVPPLRERRDDIPMLVNHFIALSSARHGKTIRNIEKRWMDLLRSYDWPGNIRELRNVIDTSVIVATGEVLTIEEQLLFWTRPADVAPVGSLQEEMTNHERALIERALMQAQGRVSGPSGAAMILHLPPSTLSARMKTLKIDAFKFKPR